MWANGNSHPPPREFFLWEKLKCLSLWERLKKQLQP